MGKRGRDGSHGEGGAKRKWAPANWNGKAIPAGTKGCLVSCVSGKEVQASKEAQDLMTQYVEGLAPPQEAAAAPAGADIASLIAEEVEDLNKPEAKLVTYHSTGIIGLAYLAFTGRAGGISPVDFVTAMSEEVKATKQCKSRLCMRFIPVEHSCQANLEDIRSTAAKLVPVAFPERDGDAEPETFSVFFEHRASAKIDRKQLIDAFVDHVPKTGYKVSLDSSQHTILVQLIKSCCTIAFVRNYRELAKFNIRELSGWVDPSKTAASAASMPDQEAAGAKASRQTQATEHAGARDLEKANGTPVQAAGNSTSDEPQGAKGASVAIAAAAAPASEALVQGAAADAPTAKHAASDNDAAIAGSKGA